MSSTWASLSLDMTNKSSNWVRINPRCQSPNKIIPMSWYTSPVVYCLSIRVIPICCHCLIIASGLPCGVKFITVLTRRSRSSALDRLYKASSLCHISDGVCMQLVWMVLKTSGDNLSRIQV